MAKFAVTYTEIYRTTYIVEAENWDEAAEKVGDMAENTPLIDTADDFDHWDVLPSDTFGTEVVPEGETDYFRELPEE